MKRSLVGGAAVISAGASIQYVYVHLAVLRENENKDYPNLHGPQSRMLLSDQLQSE